MTPSPDDLEKAREREARYARRALRVLEQFSWSSNVVRDGRLVGQQFVVADAIGRLLLEMIDNETEACAQVAERFPEKGGRGSRARIARDEAIASAIRQRSQP